MPSPPKEKLTQCTALLLLEFLYILNVDRYEEEAEDVSNFELQFCYLLCLKSTVPLKSKLPPSRETRLSSRETRLESLKKL